MATNVTYNGVTYPVPQNGNSGWGTQLTAYLVALASGSLTKAGGVVTLTANLDLGANYGIKSIFFSDRGTAASAGIFRLSNNTAVSWRNAANDGNLNLTVNASNVLMFNSLPVAALALGAANTVLKMNSGGTAFEYGTLVNANINASAAIAYSKLNLATSIVNADVSASAAIAYSKLNLATSIVNADISASAAIAYSKLAALTSANILVGSAGNVATSVAVTGDVTISNAGVTAIGSGVIVNADINASAAIDGSKLVAATDSVAGAVTTSAQSFAGLKTFYNGLKLDDDADQDALTYYRTEVVELTFTMNGASGASSTLNSTFTRIGNQVTVHFGLYRAAPGTTSTAFSCSSGWPSWALPTSSVLWIGFNIRDNGASDTSNFGYIQVTTAGVCNIGRNIAGTAWTNSATANHAGLNAVTSVTYIV